MARTDTNQIFAARSLYSSDRIHWLGIRKLSSRRPGNKAAVRQLSLFRGWNHSSPRSAKNQANVTVKHNEIEKLRNIHKNCDQIDELKMNCVCQLLGSPTRDFAIQRCSYCIQSDHAVAVQAVTHLTSVRTAQQQSCT